jgi:hypothetical protein
LAMACTVLSALAGHPSDNQLPIEKLSPCVPVPENLSDLYHVKTMWQHGPIANCAGGYRYGCCGVVLGEGRGVRSDEAESKMCDVREVGNARFQLIR